MDDFENNFNGSNFDMQSMTGLHSNYAHYQQPAGFGAYLHEKYPGKENEILRNTNPAINGEILLSGSIENDASNDFMLSGGKSPGDEPPKIDK